MRLYVLEILQALQQVHIEIKGVEKEDRKKSEEKGTQQKGKRKRKSSAISIKLKNL